MRYKAVFSVLFSLLVGTANANWTKINEVDYTWGPFNIYHITLFTETGEYADGVRPLMLTLQYKKPWAGRDFAVSLARTWNNLGIQLPEKEVDGLITHLRKTFPDIKPEDTLHYIALPDRGYFILNDKVVSNVFNKQFNDAIVAIWLDPKMDISRQLLDPAYKPKAEEKPQEPVAQATAQSEVPNTPVTEKTEEAKKSEEATKAVSNEQIVAETPVVTPQPETEKTEVAKTETQELKPVENKAPESKQVESNPADAKEEKSKAVEIENPEIFISPIYDDLLMLAKNYC